MDFVAQGGRHLQILVTAAVAGLLAFAAPAALAAVYCVHAPDCSGTAEPNLTNALSAADADATKDTIQIGPTVDIGGPYPVTTNPVAIVGAGPGNTVLDFTPGAHTSDAVLVLGAGSSVSDLTIYMAVDSTSDQIRGLRLSNGATADRVTVAGAPGNISSLQIGVLVLSGGVFRNGAISVPVLPGTTGWGVQGEGTITDSSVVAEQAALPSFTGSGLTLRRDRITGWTGVVANSATATVTDSLIRSLASGDTTHAGIEAHSDPSGDATVHVTRVTLISPFDDGIFSVSAGNTAAIDVTSSAISTGHTDLATSGSNTSVTATYSAYATSAGAVTGGAVNHDLTLTSSSMGFADGSFRLRYDSPLIDAGDPADTEPSLLACVAFGCGDVNGMARRIDGNGDGTTVVDIGAQEYQRQAPTAVASASPTSAATSQAISFDGSGSSDPDPGDTLTYAWSFDDGATAGGATVQHAFASAGDHVATLVVTDPTGRSATATAAVSVAAPAGGSNVPVPAFADLIAPVIGSARAVPRKFAIGPKPTALSAARKRGTHFRFTLSETASVTLTIQRALPGRRSGRKCVAPRPSLRRARSCTRWKTLGKLQRRDRKPGANDVAFSGRLGRRALKPGRHRALIGAVDTAGNKAVPRVANFTIVR